MITNDLLGLLTSQLIDPFRIGLVAALIYTTIRNAAATGFVVPLAAGLIFVAYITTLIVPPQNQTHSLWLQLGTGVIANAILASIIFALWQGYKRFGK